HLASFLLLLRAACVASALLTAYAVHLLNGCYFFFQAEDGIRDRNVTGVQTCALPISLRAAPRRSWSQSRPRASPSMGPGHQKTPSRTQALPWGPHRVRSPSEASAEEGPGVTDPVGGARPSPAPGAPPGRRPATAPALAA